MAYTIIQTSTRQDTYPIARKQEILVDGQSDLAGLPADAAPGSVAYTADMTGMWMKDNAGAWKKIGGGG